MTNILPFFTHIWTAFMNFWSRLFSSVDPLTTIIPPFDVDIEQSPHARRYGQNLHADDPATVRRNKEVTNELSQWNSSKVEFLRSPTLIRNEGRTCTTRCPIPRLQRFTNSHYNAPKIFVQDCDGPDGGPSPPRLCSLDSYATIDTSSSSSSLPSPPTMGSTHRNFYIHGSLPSLASISLAVDDDNDPLNILKEMSALFQANSFPESTVNSDRILSAPPSIHDDRRSSTRSYRKRASGDRNPEKKLPDIPFHQSFSPQQPLDRRFSNIPISPCKATTHTSNPRTARASYFNNRQSRLLAPQFDRPKHKSSPPILATRECDLPYADLFDFSAYAAPRSASDPQSSIRAPAPAYIPNSSDPGPSLLGNTWETDERMVSGSPPLSEYSTTRSSFSSDSSRGPPTSSTTPVSHLAPTFQRRTRSVVGSSPTASSAIRDARASLPLLLLCPSLRKSVDEFGIGFDCDESQEHVDTMDDEDSEGERRRRSTMDRITLELEEAYHNGWLYNEELFRRHR